MEKRGMLFLGILLLGLVSFSSLISASIPIYCDPTPRAFCPDGANYGKECPEFGDTNRRVLFDNVPHSALIPADSEKTYPSCFSGDTYVCNISKQCNAPNTYTCSNLSFPKLPDTADGICEGKFYEEIDTVCSYNYWPGSIYPRLGWGWTVRGDTLLGEGDPLLGAGCQDTYDNNCDGLPDCYDSTCSLDASCSCLDSDGDGYGLDPDGLGVGYSSCTDSQVDCNDTNPNINPGATEICGNFVDEDCDGIPQECSPEPATCVLDRAYWSSPTSLFEGDPADLIVEGTDCDGEEISFVAKEYDSTIFYPDDDVTTNPFNVFFIDNTAVGTWTAEYVPDEDEPSPNGNPEYYFIVTVVSDPSNTIESENPMLEVSEVINYITDCAPILNCGGYTDSANCTQDPCDKASATTIEGECSTASACEWDLSTTSCNEVKVTECNEARIGSCSYNEASQDDCDDGYLVYNWTAIWSWASSNQFPSNPDETTEDYIFEAGYWYFDPNRDSLECVNGSNVLPCPAQIKLPFFDWFNILIIVVLIGGIYYFMTGNQLHQKRNLRVKKSRKK